MSILIKGNGMMFPSNCLGCKLKIWEESEEEWICPFTGIVCLNIGRQKDCPLVALPEKHGRLIDADALADDLEWDAQHYGEDHEMKFNAAAWLRSNQNKVVIEAEGKE